MLAELSFQSLFAGTFIRVQFIATNLSRLASFFYDTFVHYALQIDIQFKEKWDSLVHNTNV